MRTTEWKIKELKRVAVSAECGNSLHDEDWNHLANQWKSTPRISVTELSGVVSFFVAYGWMDIF